MSDQSFLENRVNVHFAAKARIQRLQQELRENERDIKQHLIETPNCDEFLNIDWRRLRKALIQGNL